MTEELRSPQQQIYDAVYLCSLDLGYDTYDYLPAKEASLPFVFVGEQFDQDRQTKSSLYGDVQQTIHIYGGKRQRRQVNDMINRLKVELRKLKRTDNFYLTWKGINSQIMIDNSTSTTLLHGIVEVEFTFN